MKVAYCCEGSSNKIWTQLIIKNTELDGFPKKIRNKTFYFHTKKNFILFFFYLVLALESISGVKSWLFCKKKIRPKNRNRRNFGFHVAYIGGTYSVQKSDLDVHKKPCSWTTMLCLYMIGPLLGCWKRASYSSWEWIFVPKCFPASFKSILMPPRLNTELNGLRIQGF
jgi:hypothetical protein